MQTDLTKGLGSKVAYLAVNLMPKASLIILGFALPSRISMAPIVNVKNGLSIHAQRQEPPQILFSIVKNLEVKRITEKSTDGISLNEVVAKGALAPIQKPRDISAIRIEPMLFQKSDILAYNDDQRWTENLNPRLKKRLQLANSRGIDFSSIEEIPSTEDQLQQALQSQAAASSSVINNSKVIIKKSADSVANDQTSDDRTKDKDVVKYFAGQVRLVDGAILGTRTIHLRHYYRHEKIADQQIDPRRPVFKIPARQTEGRLAAEVIDQNGGIVASGDVILTSGLTQEQLQSLEIFVRPRDLLTANAFTFGQGDLLFPSSIKSTASNLGDVKIQNTNLGIEEVSRNTTPAGFSSMAESSWALLRTESEGKYPGLFIQKAGQNINLPIFSNSLAQAMIDIYRNGQEKSQFENNGSLVWGQVVLNGVPAAGVKIEVEGLAEVKPVFLSMYGAMLLPNQKALVTTKTGYFTFADIPAGLYSLKASVGNEYFGHVNVLVEDGHISPVAIESSVQKHLLSVNVFDAFSGAEKDASVLLQSANSRLEVRGRSETMVTPAQRWSLADIEPVSSDYLPIRVYYSDADEEVLAPMISASWLESVKISERLSVFPDRSIIVGFVQGQDFEAFLDPDKPMDQEQVVYFDSTGKIVEKGVAGGGFIIFNVATGLQSVVVFNQATGQTATQLSLNDANSVTSLQFRF